MVRRICTCVIRLCIASNTLRITAQEMMVYLSDVRLCARTKWFHWRDHTFHLVHSNLKFTVPYTNGSLRSWEFSRVTSMSLLDWIWITQWWANGNCYNWWRENHVSGWDDPRMPTISGMRRRGYTPESIRRFVIWLVSHAENMWLMLACLSFVCLEDLNKIANRVMVKWILWSWW